MNKTKERFVLTIEEKNSKLWQRLMAHWEARIAQLRIENDDETKDEKTTAATRGRIAEVKANLALDRDRPNVI